MRDNSLRFIKSSFGRLLYFYFGLGYHFVIKNWVLSPVERESTKSGFRRLPRSITSWTNNGDSECRVRRIVLQKVCAMLFLRRFVFCFYPPRRYDWFIAFTTLHNSINAHQARHHIQWYFSMFKAVLSHLYISNPSSMRSSSSQLVLKQKPYFQYYS